MNDGGLRSTLAVIARMAGSFNPHFIARITLLTKAEGGRKTPANLRGYRPDMRLPLEPGVQYGVFFDRDAGEIEPGQTRELEFQIRTAASLCMPLVDEGTAIVLVEGDIQIARGVVTGVYRRDD